MQTIQLNTGDKIPTIGFGTWQILLNGKAKRSVTEALNCGYRLIDTALVYGNEKGVGAAINDSGIPRDQIFLTTKLWNSDQGYESAHRAISKSLRRLNVSYVDMYLIHWPRGRELAKESWRAMEEMFEQGLTKNIGVSNFGVDELTELLSSANVQPAVNQIEFHPLLYRDQLPTIKFCKKHKIIVEAYSPLARGKILRNSVVEDIAQQVGKTPSQVLLRWALQHGTIPLPKTTHADRMRENIDIFDFALSPESMSHLNSLSNGTSVL